MLIFNITSLFPSPYKERRGSGTHCLRMHTPHLHGNTLQGIMVTCTTCTMIPSTSSRVYQALSSLYRAWRGTRLQENMKVDLSSILRFLLSSSLLVIKSLYQAKAILCSWFWSRNECTNVRLIHAGMLILSPCT